MDFLSNHPRCCTSPLVCIRVRSWPAHQIQPSDSSQRLERFRIKTDVFQAPCLFSKKKHVPCTIIYVILCHMYMILYVYSILAQDMLKIRCDLQGPWSIAIRLPVFTDLPSDETLRCLRALEHLTHPFFHVHHSHSLGSPKRIQLWVWVKTLYPYIKIAGRWVFIALKKVSKGINP